MYFLKGYESPPYGWSNATGSSSLDCLQVGLYTLFIMGLLLGWSSSREQLYKWGPQDAVQQANIPVWCHCLQTFVLYFLGSIRGVLDSSCEYLDRLVVVGGGGTWGGWWSSLKWWTSVSVYGRKVRNAGLGLRFVESDSNLTSTGFKRSNPQRRGCEERWSTDPRKYWGVFQRVPARGNWS